MVSTVQVTGEMLVRWGREHWRIEGFFKTMKSRFGLDQFGQRTALGAYRFITLAFMAYLLTYWSDHARRCVLWSRTALDKPEWLIDLDWAAIAREARDSMMPEVRLSVLETEVIRLQGLVGQSVVSY